MRFTRHRGAIRADLDDVELQVLRQLAGELLALVDEPEVSEDPLAALVGMPPGEVPAPEDDILRRLLPDAYRDDADAAGEFRRFTDADLRTSKRANALAVLQTLPDVPGRMTLSRDDVDAWLGLLNDVRLALGTALGVTEESDLDDYEQDDPAYQTFSIYGWLGYLQESLLSCVEPRLP
ncbi:MAG: hypothetical protein JWO12_884 [Frankiales bacterium]|nr:hypothetical protein [Frankiales bacterium]